MEEHILSDFWSTVKIVCFNIQNYKINKIILPSHCVARLKRYDSAVRPNDAYDGDIDDDDDNAIL
jgi:hypothetical protein